MQKNTSVTLGEHFEAFIAEQIKSGRFSSASEAIRAGLRLLEERELKLAVLRQALKDGEASGVAEYSLHGLIEEFFLTADKACPVCCKPVCITPQQYNEQGKPFVEPPLLIEGCDCLKVVLEGFLQDIFQGLKYDYERDILRDFPKRSRQETQKGNPVRLAYKDFPCLVDDKKDWRYEPNGNNKPQYSV